jgi:dienelactone hydrolase
MRIHQPATCLRALFCALLLLPALSLAASAAVQHKTVEYKDGDTLLEGYLAWDDAQTMARPGVIVVHEWMGLNDYAKMRADMLAELGYIAFAADIYGKGVRPSNPQEAGAEAGKYRSDRALLRSRMNSALAQLKALPDVDSARVAAIGYCFGGMSVLELARSGADIAGVVSFHGSLDTPNPADAKNIKAKVLVLTGAADPHVPAEQVAALQKELTDAHVDWQLKYFSDAMHAFTNPASNNPSGGAQYNERADKRSWQDMLDFFAEIFSE